MGFGGLVHGRTGMFKKSKSYPHQNGLEICGEDTNFDRRSWERGREIHCIFPFGPERDGVAHNPTDTRRHRPRICALPHTQSPMICSITRMPTQYEIEEGKKKKKREREREDWIQALSMARKRRTYYPWNQERRHDKAPFAISFCHTCYIYAYVYVYVYINAPRFVSYRLTLTDIMSLTMVYVNMLYIALRPINVLVRRTRDQLTNGHMSLLT